MKIVKLIFAIVCTIYFLLLAYNPDAGSFFDIVDLPIHEAGHLFFRIFGEFMGVAGGTLLQLIVPAVFVGYFAYNEKPYSAAIVLFWLGQSFLNCFIYANDAVVMKLVLLGGLTGSEGGFHDWNYLLSELGLLGSTPGVAMLIRAIGTILILLAAIFSIKFSFREEIETTYEI